MSVVTYVAVDRGRLAGGHSASTQYQIECFFEAYPETQVSKGIRDEALDGTPEGWLDAVQYEYQIRTDLVLSGDRDNWQEFFSSVANAETFQLDFTGTIASPGTDVDVFLVGTVVETQVGGAGHRYAFRAKTFG